MKKAGFKSRDYYQRDINGVQRATIKNKKGAIGGMIMRIKRNNREIRRDERNNRERINYCWIRVENKKWKSIGLYVKENLERKLEKLKKQLKKNKEKER